MSAPYYAKFFYGCNGLPDAQLTVSNHWRQQAVPLWT